MKELLPREESCPEPYLQAIWAFALVKGGALVQHWYLESICRDSAFNRLHSGLRDPNDQKELWDLFLKNTERPEAALWAVWEFALLKGADSAGKWRAGLDALRQRELMEETKPSRKRLWAKCQGWYKGFISHLRHQY